MTYDIPRCPKGHPLVVRNVYLSMDKRYPNREPRVRCRTCEIKRKLEYYYAKKAKS